MVKKQKLHNLGFTRCVENPSFTQCKFILKGLLFSEHHDHCVSSLTGTVSHNRNFFFDIIKSELLIVRLLAKSNLLNVTFNQNIVNNAEIEHLGFWKEE